MSKSKRFNDFLSDLNKVTVAVRVKVPRLICAQLFFFLTDSPSCCSASLPDTARFVYGISLSNDTANPDSKQINSLSSHHESLSLLK